MNSQNTTELTSNSQTQEIANIDNSTLATNEGLQQALNLVKNNNILQKIANNIGVLNSNTNQEIKKIVASAPGVIEDFKDKFISKLEKEKIQNIIKSASIEFGKRLGILGNAFIINDNPFIDIFFSIKSVFDLILYEFFNILLFVNIVILNIDENVAIANFKSNISKSNILDKFLLSILTSVKNLSENVLQSVKNEAFSILFKHYKTDEKTVELITNLSTEVIHNTVHNFFEIFYISNLNPSAKANANDTPNKLMTPKMVGGKLKKLKTKKQKILKRIKTYLASFHNINHKSKTLKRRRG
jgi:hypothetical protein